MKHIVFCVPVGSEGNLDSAAEVSRYYAVIGLIDGTRVTRCTRKKDVHVVKLHCVQVILEVHLRDQCSCNGDAWWRVATIGFTRDRR